MPKLSVICPTLNEEKSLGILLHSLKQQTFRDFEVIVVDSFSKDLTPRIAALFGARLIQVEGRVSKARNQGAAVATAPYLLFIDADAVFQTPTWLTEFMTFVDEHKIRCAHVHYAPREKGLFLQAGHAISALFNWHYNLPGGWFIFVEKEIFDKVKFDEEINAGEGIDFGYRVQDFCDLWLVPMDIETSQRRVIKYGALDTAGKALCWYQNPDKIKEKCNQCYDVGNF
jgi:glycosyltransferase involved in cell wall biosynthesis